ncbi:glycosyltransferase [Oceanobacillus piezotolerans]|uniref:Glycosyltransferase n=1 Tax=Oceanobacillus piezotolerans TaxID=2448030 RepID=A0A498D487_9BACI|nr:glycosyltransferase [Oceanobacillus piezotolerans]RLL42769.1 glycosyltransferase [Oceanobacillus piezotolerans]
MKIKVLYMVINMNIGGTEKALLNMIAEMPKEQYDITILMLEKYGGFLEEIPEEVTVEYVDGYSEIKDIYQNPPKETFKSYIVNGNIIKGFTFSIVILLSKILNNKGLFFKYILKDTPALKKGYDTAVAYAGPMDLISYFVVHKIKAKKRVQWIHFDVTKIGFDFRFANKLYPKFNKIYVVSKEGKEKLTNILPNLINKIEAYPNKISTNLILKLAGEGQGFKDDFEGIRILTVGRLSKEKGQDLVIPVLTKLRKKGYKVRWYCIGEGKARSDYEKLIKKYDVEENFVLLGAYSNPYPFMKQCDIYVQPSRHEGFCITLAEAKCFFKSIITTDFIGAKEQLTNFETGFIVGTSENEIYQALEKVIKSKRSLSN